MNGRAWSKNRYKGVLFKTDLHSVQTGQRV